ncbi:hypothetical protein HZA33_01220 [Candidatus Pacearchaeota archaeon]|nr:hypothetical protein [Candidatus Pacearchaeota archaeon]
MIEVNAKTKQWGNSLGILIPRRAVLKGKLKPEQEIRIIIEKPKATKVRDIFGKLKVRGKSTQKALEEIDREFEEDEF